jgi:glutamate dehydrogenase
LKREIIATILSNAVVNRMGIAFAHRMAADHGVTRAEVLKAYAAAHDIFQADRYWRAIEGLDNQVPTTLQYRLMQRATGLLKHATGWMLGAKLTEQYRVGELAARYGEAVAELEKRLPEELSPAYRQEWEAVVAGLRAERLPEATARSLANTLMLGSALDIADLAVEAGVPLQEAAAVYFHTGERFRMLWLHAAIVALKVSGNWQALARNNLRDDAYRIHRMLAARVLQHPGAAPEARVDAWIAANERRVRFAQTRLSELQATASTDFQALAVAVRELRKLRSL